MVLVYKGIKVDVAIRLCKKASSKLLWWWIVFTEYLTKFFYARIKALRIVYGNHLLSFGQFLSIRLSL